MSRYFDWASSLKRFVRFDTARSEDINDALDELTAGLDDLDLDVNRSIKLPIGTADQTLAFGAGARANKVLAFDGSGNITLSANDVDTSYGSSLAAAASATAAEESASDALGHANAALGHANSAAASFDAFDDRYLGAKASDPSVDNDGGALLTGALYWNTTVPEMRVYTGSAWVDVLSAPDVALTGVPTAPTATAGTNTTQVATTAFVQTAVNTHINDTTDAHAATAITNTPAGGISATTVQAAINELDTEKAPKASPVFTGSVTVPDQRIDITTSVLPTIRPTLNLDFANSQAVDPRIAFTRPSPATYYDGKTFAKAEENLLLYSQEFDNAAWANIGTTETANTATAPDGTTTADTLDDGTLSSGHDMGQNASATTGVPYTFSAYVKDVDRQFVILAASSSLSAYATAKFDLTAVTAGTSVATGTGWSVASSSITSVGNGWYRCVLVFTPGSSSITCRIGMGTDSTTITSSQRGLESYTGTNKRVYVWGAQLEQRSVVTAYTPTTTAPITRYVPKLMTAVSGQPRIDFDPVTLACRGLLIEESRTNLFQRSEEFDNAYWSKVSGTVTPNASTAPDGTTTMDKWVVDNTVTSTAAYLNLGVTKAASATTYTLSYFVKAAEKGGFRIYVRDSATSANFSIVTFNITNGTIQTAASAGGTFTAASAPTPTDCGGGIYRCSLTFTTGTETSIAIRPFAMNSDGTAFTGDGTSGIFVWGAQLEAGAFATSYIPTTTASATRAADVATMNGVNFSSWYRQDAGTFLVEAGAIDNISGTTARAYVSTFSSGLSDLFAIEARSSTNTRVRTVVGGVSVTPDVVFDALGVSTKIAGAYGSNGATVAVPGIAPATLTSSLPTATSMYLGGRADGVAGAQINGSIRRVIYWPSRLTDAQLQALTTA